MTPANPYIAGNPVGNSTAFVGRTDILDAVRHMLRRDQDNALVLHGQRRIGKTSILQHLATWLPDQGNCVPVEFDLQDKATLPLGHVLQELAERIAYTLNAPHPDLGDAVEMTFQQTWLPETLNGLPETLNGLPDGAALILLFDEFDVLADPEGGSAAADFFPYLRQLLALDPKRLNFIFVLGRNVTDLSNIALSLFKSTDAKRISLLRKSDTRKLIRLSEANQTLHWSDAAAERVWQLTNGHPFLTQQLCSHVWEQAYDEDPRAIPTATPEMVDEAIPETLDASLNTLEWLWDGLPPAERIVAAALAEAGPTAISQAELEQALQEAGIRVVIRELQNAPQLLEDWDWIAPEADRYRFRVELLRQWLTANKPLQRVQEELDRIAPAAESIYQGASSLYQGGNLDQARALLRQAVELNPNHIGANQLLADILLAQHQPSEAVELLETLYGYQPAAARPRLIQALLTQAKDTTDETVQRQLYDRIVAFDAHHPEARKFQLKQALAGLQGLEDNQQYSEALALAEELAQTYADLETWPPILARLEQKTRLNDLYQQGLGALLAGDRQTAQTLLAQVIALEPSYEETTRYLHQAVTGVDIAAVMQQLAVTQATKHNADASPKVTQDQAGTLSQTVEVVSEHHNQRRLSSANPLDYLRLLWWLLVMPQGLKSYREQFGQEDEKRVTGWLVSFLTWFPLFMPALALSLNQLPSSNPTASTPVYLGLSTVIGFAFLLTGWLNNRDDDWVDSAAVVVAVVVADGVKDRLQTGQASWILRGIFSLLAIAQGGVFWFSFLGGWRVFQ